MQDVQIRVGGGRLPPERLRLHPHVRVAARAIGREQAAAEEHQRLASRKPRKAREQIAQRRESLGDLQLGDAANRARFRLNLVRAEHVAARAFTLNHARHRVAVRRGDVDDLGETEVELAQRRIEQPDDLVQTRADRHSIVREIERHARRVEVQANEIVGLQTIDELARRNRRRARGAGTKTGLVHGQDENAIGGGGERRVRRHHVSRAPRLRLRVPNQIRGDHRPALAVERDLELIRRQTGDRQPLAIDHLHVDGDELNRRSEDRRLQTRRERRERADRDHPKKRGEGVR